jgi:hypothetical protein
MRTTGANTLSPRAEAELLVLEGDHSGAERVVRRAMENVGRVPDLEQLWGWLQEEGRALAANNTRRQAC